MVRGTAAAGQGFCLELPCFVSDGSPACVDWVLSTAAFLETPVRNH